MLELFSPEGEEDSEDSQITDAEVEHKFAADLDGAITVQKNAEDEEDELTADREARLDAEGEVDDGLAAELEAWLDAEASESEASLEAEPDDGSTAKAEVQLDVEKESEESEESDEDEEL